MAIYTTKSLVIWGTCLFLISWVWQWMYLYQEEMSKQHYTMSSAPLECVNVINEQALTFTNMMRGLFGSAIALDRQCQQYFKATMVNPIYKVNPMVALSHMLSSIIFRPLRVLGNELGHGVANLFYDLSFVVKIIVAVVITIIVVALIWLIRNRVNAHGQTVVFNQKVLNQESVKDISLNDTSKTTIINNLAKIDQTMTFQHNLIYHGYLIHMAIHQNLCKPSNTTNMAFRPKLSNQFHTTKSIFQQNLIDHGYTIQMAMNQNTSKLGNTTQMAFHQHLIKHGYTIQMAINQH